MTRSSDPATRSTDAGWRRRSGAARRDLARRSAAARSDRRRVCDLGLAWRDAARREPRAVHETPRIRSVGLPVVLNRTPEHEALLGAGYPLLADGDRPGRRVERRATTRSSGSPRSAAGWPGRVHRAAGHRPDPPPTRRAIPGRSGACPSEPSAADPGCQPRLQVLFPASGQLRRARLEIRVDRWEGLVPRPEQSRG